MVLGSTGLPARAGPRRPTDPTELIAATHPPPCEHSNRAPPVMCRIPASSHALPTGDVNGRRRERVGPPRVPATRACREGLPDLGESSSKPLQAEYLQLGKS